MATEIIAQTKATINQGSSIAVDYDDDSPETYVGYERAFGSGPKSYSSWDK